MKEKLLFPLDRLERKKYVLEQMSKGGVMPRHVSAYMIGFLDAIDFLDSPTIDADKEHWAEPLQ